MSLIIPQQDPALDERTRDAWRRYADELRGLEGAEYEHAEHEAWEHLQADLAAIAADVADGSDEPPGSPI